MYLFNLFIKIVGKVDKHVGTIAINSAIVAVVTCVAVILAPMVIAVSPVVLAIVSGVSAAAAVTSLGTGCYYIGQKNGATQERERVKTRAQDARNASLILERVTAEIAVDALENNEAVKASEKVVTELDATVAQHELLLNNLDGRVNDANTKQATDQVDLQKQFADLQTKNTSTEERLSRLEGLLANGIFPNNPSGHRRDRSAANDDNGPRQRGRQQTHG